MGTMNEYARDGIHRNHQPGLLSRCVYYLSVRNYGVCHRLKLIVMCFLQIPGLCHRDPSCYSHLIDSNQIRLMPSPEEAEKAAVSSPMQIDAIVSLSYHVISASDGSSLDDGVEWSYVIRMNHTDVPPTGLVMDLFDVSPTPTNGLGYYRDYWFFSNLQYAIDRAVIGMEMADLARDVDRLTGVLPDPVVIQISIRPFPWPAATEDLGAAVAATFLNLLLVFAFLSPTAAAVSALVREKELRLREGMRILGEI